MIELSKLNNVSSFLMVGVASFLVGTATGGSGGWLIRDLKANLHEATRDKNELEAKLLSEEEASRKNAASAEIKQDISDRSASTKEKNNEANKVIIKYLPALAQNSASCPIQRGTTELYDAALSGDTSRISDPSLQPKSGEPSGVSLFQFNETVTYNNSICRQIKEDYDLLWEFTQRQASALNGTQVPEAVPTKEGKQ
jgi:hypothetical protein